MKIRGRLFLAITVVSMFVNMNLLSVNAEIFDIGEKMQSDLELASQEYHTFTSGAIVRADDDEINLTSLIFDGNLSTGINTSDPLGSIHIRVYFPIPLFITNITAKPNFDKGSSNYSLTVFIVDRVDSYFILCSSENIERTFQMNCYIDSIDIDIYPNGSEPFYFNDVIINYTLSPSNLTGVVQAIDALTNTVNSLQNQLDNLNLQIDILNNMIIDLLNNSKLMNQTQHQILENVTGLWSAYNQLNITMMSISETIENLNSSTHENITQLNNDLTLIGDDITNIYQSLDNSTTNITELWSSYNQLDTTIMSALNEIEDLDFNTNMSITQILNGLAVIELDIYDIYGSLDHLNVSLTMLSTIQEEIDRTTQDIKYLNENITEIKDTMPSEYDDGPLTTRIFQLESENTVLNAKIENLSEEIEKLKEAQDEPDDFVVLAPFVLSFLGILIAIVAVIFASRKLGEKTLPADKEESEESIHSEEDENKVNEEET